MFSFRRLLPLWWALLFVSSAIGQEPAPQVVSPLMLANNPTLTTVALQKPVCVFDSFIRKDTAAVTPDYSQYVVALYGMQASAPKQNIDGFGTFRNTSGGASEPYIVARFAVPNCTALGGGASTDTLQQYLVRVGENTTCLNDPNFSGICNPPLANNTAYRFVYGLFNKTTPHVIDQTLWSDKIITKAAKSSDSIDTWPGRRSGGMIVITSILSTLLFLLLAGFVAAVAANILSGASAGVQTTRHETTVHQQAAPKAQASADPAYSSVIQGGAPERYAAKPQV